MAELQINAAPRVLFGKKVKALRRNSIIPGNVYGEGIASTAIQLGRNDFERLRAKGAGRMLLTLHIEGEALPRTVMVREVQRHPVTEDMFHIEFYQVQMDHAIKTSVPLILVGESEAVTKHHGMLMQLLNTLDLECLPGDMVAEVTVDVSRLTEIGQALHVSDLVIGPRVTVLTDPEQLVVRASPPVVEAARAEQAEAAEAPAADKQDGA
ncbi:MAG: 50S ribosomal protein L25 [Dehalococcoidia bacterium]|nr:50S ribosomal protein L25 [Dehalococcoidia bacterium]